MVSSFLEFRRRKPPAMSKSRPSLESDGVFPTDAKQGLLSAEIGNRLAAIDIGTNSVRLVVAEAHGSSYRVLDDEKATTRLGRGLHASGRLDETAVEESLLAIARMKQIADGYQVRAVRAIATCAVREATDGADFVRRVEEETGVSIDVIDSEEEGLLAFTSVRRAFEVRDSNFVLADIGGGSTEIVLASGDVVEAVFATQLGAVRLTEQFGGGALGDQAFLELTRWIDESLKKTTGKLDFRPQMLFGSGGTFTTLGSMSLAASGGAAASVHGLNVSRADVRHLLDRLRKLDPEARRKTPGISLDRADIVVAGLAIIDRIMRRFRVNQLRIHGGGVRDGLLLRMIEESIGAAPTTPEQREAAIDAFAARCGSDLRHEKHVAYLAGRLFDQLAEPFDIDPDAREILTAAARLQDVGYLIDYEEHHKHSYRLIRNSRLPGFRPRTLELIANVARYHRGARPKKKHDNYRGLTDPEQRLVAQAAAILRLAGGLDRSHSLQVRDVLVQTGQGTVVLQVVADDSPEVDLWGARRRTELFERVFDVQVAVEWEAGGEEAATPVSGGGDRRRKR